MRQMTGGGADSPGGGGAEGGRTGLGEESVWRRGRRQVDRDERIVTDRARSEYFLEALVGVPSVSGSEEQGVEVCRLLMAEVGLATRVRPCAAVPGARNVEGRLGTGVPQALPGRSPRHAPA